MSRQPSNAAHQELDLGRRIVRREVRFFERFEARVGPFDTADRAARQDEVRRVLALRDDLPDLAARWKALDGLRWSLAQCAASLVRHEAKRAYQVRREDAEAAAWLGLYQAACVWDPERGLRFSTYARWTVRSKLKEAAEAHGRLVRVPQTMQRRLSLLRRERSFTTSLARAAERVGMKQRDALRLWLRAGGTVESMDSTVDEDGRPLRDRLAGDHEDPVDRIDRERRLVKVRAVLDDLGDRDRAVLAGRFGLEGEARSFRELGESLGVSGERARQLCRRAEKRVRKAVA